MKTLFLTALFLFSSYASLCPERSFDGKITLIIESQDSYTPFHFYAFTKNYPQHDPTHLLTCASYGLRFENDCEDVVAGLKEEGVRENFVSFLNSLRASDFLHIETDSLGYFSEKQNSEIKECIDIISSHEQREIEVDVILYGSKLKVLKNLELNHVLTIDPQGQRVDKSTKFSSWKSYFQNIDIKNEIHGKSIHDERIKEHHVQGRVDIVMSEGREKDEFYMLGESFPNDLYAKSGHYYILKVARVKNQILRMLRN